MDCTSIFLHAEREEVQDEDTLRIQRKFIRSGSSPLDIPNNTFIKLFRLSKGCFIFILEEIKGEFKARKSSGIPTILKLAATLRFLAEGSYQTSVGQDFNIGMAQPTVSIVMSETLEILEKILCPKLIKFEMTQDEKNEAKSFFYQQSGFPGVIMCVDGTHISIIRPNVNEHNFFNRKGNHSINAMMVCNHKMVIKCVNASYGGSSHDSVIWSLSPERQYMEDRFKNGEKSFILGDAGYTLEPWLMTPYRSAGVNTPEAKFNTIHSKCRCIIERCFGVLKGRFRCLLHSRELHYQPNKTARIINVCTMLHNACIKYNVSFDEELYVEDFDIFDLNIPEPINLLNNTAKRIRDQIKNSF